VVGRPSVRRETNESRSPIACLGQEKGRHVSYARDVPFLTLLGEDESPFVGAASS
jgi:hypothetical protein